MKLKKLQLENFRSYQTHEHQFAEDSMITILVGENGRGKTNLLEAIYLLSLGRSFRISQYENMIKWDSQHALCLAEVEIEGEAEEFQVFLENAPRRRKHFKINQATAKGSEYIGRLLTVLFHPEDLNMLYLSPSYRRKYLDLLLSQTDRSYLRAAYNYQKLLKQRNTLLKDIRTQRFQGGPQASITLEANLDAWDSQLVEYGREVIDKRLQLTEYLSEHLGDLYRSISDHSEEVRVEYRCKAESSTQFAENLAGRRDLDIIKGKTTVGPHLDDLEFYLDGRPLSAVASRGEFRTLLLAIKLAEIPYIYEKTGHYPLLLLDDVFSELDPLRQQSLLKSIKNCQTIITATDLNGLEDLLKANPAIVHMEC